MLTVKQYSFPRFRIECSPNYYVNSTDIEHITFVLVPKETLLINWRKAGSPDWHITHHCAFANIHIDRWEIVASTTPMATSSTALKTWDRRVRAPIRKHPLTLFERKRPVGFLCPGCLPTLWQLTSLLNCYFTSKSKFCPGMIEMIGFCIRQYKIFCKTLSYIFPHKLLTKQRR